MATSGKCGGGHMALTSRMISIESSSSKEKKKNAVTDLQHQAGATLSHPRASASITAELALPR